ncbi:hypothetical protein [Tessaracoccus coleopterorum]|uniref:hypothetical protein n=1 Tax=Tessaracoccus coleopterorum TaxID=2714950 RepID=UPI0018D277A7|nr:hypothetical protein [Tessaracoccus coleopterorum]
MSLLAVGAGVVLFLFRRRIAAIQATFPQVATAEEMYHRSMHGIDRIAVEVTARVQRAPCRSTSARSS